MVMLCASELDVSVDLEKCLKMAIIHDIGETIIGDIPYFKENNDNKERKERKSLKEIKSLINSKIGDEIFNLWDEYQQNKTYESKFVRALDKMEAQIQRNEAPLSTWIDREKSDSLTRLDKYCNFDSFLRKMKLMIQSESRDKLKEKEKSIF